MLDKSLHVVSVSLDLFSTRQSIIFSAFMFSFSSDNSQYSVLCVNVQHIASELLYHVTCDAVAVLNAGTTSPELLPVGYLVGDVSSISVSLRGMCHKFT